MKTAIHVCVLLIVSAVFSLGGALGTVVESTHPPQHETAR